MAQQYYLRAVAMESGEETGDDALSERSWSQSATVDRADRIAEEYFGGDDVTWFEKVGGGSYMLHVGRILDDGNRSEALIEITVMEEEVEDEEDTETA